MDNGLTLESIEQYVNVVIPNIENELGSPDLSDKDRVTLYNLYTDVLKMVAPWDFPTFNKYLELDEDHNNPNKAFYHQRKDHMGEIFQSFNDLEVYDKYDILLIMSPPRVGKSTVGIRFLSWIIGKHPEGTQLATSYSDNITNSFYIGVMEVVENPRFKEVFPKSPLVNQNAKREEIWLKVKKRYPSITMVPINGSMTGRCEASHYLYCDDLVSGLEEALSKPRLDKLYGTYSVNCKQRKKDGAKEIHIATPWSVHDVISRLARDNKDNPRCKIIRMPCYDEHGESAFNFNGGFSTKYYKDLEKGMDPLSFRALYLQDPIEREGILYDENDLKFYFQLPQEPPDTIIAVADSKNLGKDYVCGPVGYVYDDIVYIEDVVYHNGLPDTTQTMIANSWLKHKVVRADIEMNNGGHYYAEKVDGKIRDGGGKTSIRTFFTGNNKITKIITYSDFVKTNFVFKHPSTYPANSQYAEFIKALTSWTQTGSNDNDDAPDAIAMLAQLVQDLSGISIKILDRRTLKL